jgi:hypothetical protein
MKKTGLNGNNRQGLNGSRFFSERAALYLFKGGPCSSVQPLNLGLRKLDAPVGYGYGIRFLMYDLSTSLGACIARSLKRF